LVQRGSHDELVRVPGPYRETALLQLMDLGGDEPGDDADWKPKTEGSASAGNLDLEVSK